MSDALSESAIVRALAQDAAGRITRKVIAGLQRINETFSGDDSELKTIWDEICVQVQYEESFLWDFYEETVRALVEAYVADLPKYEREAIWLQTDAGSGWDCELPENREPHPVFDDEIVDYLIQEYVYSEAGCWSNARIRAYIDRSSLCLKTR
jgi:hypothetical protein